MPYYLTVILFYSIPAAVIAFFVVSLIRYLRAKKKNRNMPGTYTDTQLKARRLCLIVSSVIAGVLVTVVLAFACLLFMAIAFM